MAAAWGEQRWLSPHCPAPAPLARSRSPPVTRGGQAASPLLPTATGVVALTLCNLLLIAEHSWDEVDGYFLRDPSVQEWKALVGSQAPLHIRSYLLGESNMGGFSGLHQKKRAFTDKVLPLPN